MIDHNDARNTCKLLRWVEQMDQVIADCEAQRDDIECVRMARVMREFRDNEIERARGRLAIPQNREEILPNFAPAA